MNWRQVLCSQHLSVAIKITADDISNRFSCLYPERRTCHFTLVASLRDNPYEMQHHMSWKKHTKNCLLLNCRLLNLLRECWGLILSNIETDQYRQYTTAWTIRTLRANWANDKLTCIFFRESTIVGLAFQTNCLWRDDLHEIPNQTFYFAWNAKSYFSGK